VTDTTSHLFSGPPAYVPRTPWRVGWALLATLFISIAGVLTLSGLLSIDKVVRGLGRAQGLWREDMGTLLTLAAWQIVTIGLTIGASALSGGKVSDVLALRAPAGGVRTYAIAAGNSSTNACNYSPARVAEPTRGSRHDVALTATPAAATSHQAIR